MKSPLPMLMSPLQKSASTVTRDAPGKTLLHFSVATDKSPCLSLAMARVHPYLFLPYVRSVTEGGRGSLGKVIGIRASYRYRTHRIPQSSW